MEKAIYQKTGKSGAEKSYEAGIEAGRPTKFSFDHRTGKGIIVKDNPLAKKRRKLKELKKRQLKYLKSR